MFSGRWASTGAGASADSVVGVEQVQVPGRADVEHGQITRAGRRPTSMRTRSPVRRRTWSGGLGTRLHVAGQPVGLRVGGRHGFVAAAVGDDG